MQQFSNLTEEHPREVIKLIKTDYWTPTWSG